MLHALALCWTLAHGQSATVTYSAVAKPISAILADLSQQANTRLQVEEPIGRQPLILSVKDASLDDLMARVAKITCGKWDKSGANPVLRVDEDAVQAAKARWHKKLAKIYEDVIARKEARLQKSGPFTAQKAQSLMDTMHKMMSQVSLNGANFKAPSEDEMAPFTEMPNMRALTNMLAAIGPDALADASDGERVVFSTSPNRMQRAVDGSAAIQEYQEGEKALNSVLGTIPNIVFDPKNPNAFGAGNQLDPDMMDSMVAAGLKGPEAVSKMDLAISQKGDGMDIKLLVFDGKGKAADTVPDELGLDGSDMTDPAALAAMLNPAKSPSKDSFQITLSPESQYMQSVPFQPSMHGFSLSRIRAMMAGAINAQAPGEPPKNLFAELRRPDLRDPLSYSESECIIGLAAHKNVQVLALLPDSCYGMFHGMETKAGDIEDALDSRMNLMVSTDGNWMEIQSANPDEMFHKRLDRGELKNYLATISGSPDQTLDAYGNYSLQHLGQDHTIRDAYTQILNVVSPASFNDSEGFGAALYACLDLATRQRLAQGEAIPLSGIGEDADRVLSAMVYLYGDQMPFNYSFGSDPTEAANGGGATSTKSTADMVGAMKEMMVGSEPTELFPNGLPANGKLSMTTSDQGIEFIDGDQTLDANTIAMTRLQMSDPKKFGEVDTPIPAHFRIYKNTQITFRLVLGPKQERTLSLSDDRPYDDKTYTWETLPPEIHALIAKAEDEIGKAGASPVTPGIVTPTPAPITTNSGPPSF
jgi:hypothetical protein